MTTQTQITGCLLGLALGDAMGAPHEGGWAERLAWRLIGTTGQGKMRWTDDTQMALDVATSLLIHNTLDPDHLSLQFANNYRWSRGYGLATVKVLKKIKQGQHWQYANRSIFKEGSLGNGAAMRSPIIGVFFYDDQDALINAATTCAMITHAHPLAIEGAVIIAIASSLALQSSSAMDIFEGVAASCNHEQYSRRLTTARQWLQQQHQPSPAEVVAQLGNGLTAEATCVTALYIGLRFLDKPFTDMMQFIINCGGDVDTIGSMAGAIWGSCRGTTNLPREYLQQLEQLEHLETIALSLANRILD